MAKNPAETPFIRIRGLTKEFLLGQQRVLALDHVDLDLHEGEILVIMGPSGSGKSTLLNLIGGLDRPTSGSIVVQGVGDIAGLDEIGLAQFRRRTIGFVFQSFNLIPTMTAAQNVEFPMIFSGVARQVRHQRAAELLGSVGLAERLDHRPVELSGGEQQRVAIARALANSPHLVVGDEPTGNLDSRTGLEVLGILKELNAAGKTVVVVTHDPRVAEFADRVVYMEDGRIVREG